MVLKGIKVSLFILLVFFLLCGSAFAAEPYHLPGVLLEPPYPYPHMCADGKIDGPKADFIHYRGNGEHHACPQAGGIPLTLIAISCGYVNKVYFTTITHA